MFVSFWLMLFWVVVFIVKCNWVIVVKVLFMVVVLLDFIVFCMIIDWFDVLESD